MMVVGDGISFGVIGVGNDDGFDVSLRIGQIGIVEKVRLKLPAPGNQIAQLGGATPNTLGESCSICT